MCNSKLYSKNIYIIKCNSSIYIAYIELYIIAFEAIIYSILLVFAHFYISYKNADYQRIML